MDVQYERRRRRVKMSRQVRVRPSSPVDKHFEEVRATVSASPDGLYFTTWRDAYYQGMRLLITFPYSSGMSSPEFFGEVVSVDSLSGLRRGVGVRFLTTIAPMR